MSLTDLWRRTPEQLREKHVQQVIAFAGDGKLLDGSKASLEFREFLSLVPSGILENYAGQCVNDRFDASGLALQDIVNQVGRRLGFAVTHGRYRGAIGEIGFDGLWQQPGGIALVVEVKTTDAYRIALDTVANYRRSLIGQGKITEQSSSILMVVGREDTGDLEAQIRGSKHAWDIRLIGVDALLRLARLKEELEDPSIARRIPAVLVPHEYTRVDGIIDLALSAAEDIRDDETLPRDSEEEKVAKRDAPVSFHDACITRVEKHFGIPLLRQSRIKFVSTDGAIAVVCAVSRDYGQPSRSGYWFSFHQHQRDFLSGAVKAFVVLGCGSETDVLLIPFSDFDRWIPDMNVTHIPDRDRHYWHVHISAQNNRYLLRLKSGHPQVDLTQYLLHE